MGDLLDQPTVVHDEPHPDGRKVRGTLIDTPYNAAFVEDVKSRWSHGERTWSPESECWWVTAGHESEVEDMVEEHYGHLRIVESDGSETYRDGGGSYSQGGLW